MEQLDEGRRLGGDNSILHNSLQRAYHGKGLRQEALDATRLQFERSGDSEAVAALGRGYEAGGYEQAMRSVTEARAARAETSYVESRTIAKLCMRAGDEGRALDWLEKGV